ncbi:MAG: InlB B-repeat-containing protein [Silanimonas sp.]
MDIDSVRSRFVLVHGLLLGALLAAGVIRAEELDVMPTGLGSGRIDSTTPGIDCGADCSESVASGGLIELTATPDVDSVFVGWVGDCSGAGTCALTMTQDRRVRARFEPIAAIPEIADFTPEGLRDYLVANPQVNTPARFLRALPAEFRQNWLMMSRSESLQTGTAKTPRFLLPSADMRFVFTFGMQQHSAYPGAHPNAIEYMQWDPAEKNFRFHEIVLDAIPPIGVLDARARGVAADDAKCFACHSTRNVLNRSTSPGTTGIPIGLVRHKAKPNWETYDSWAGLLPFNRDRIYQGSVEAAAFRTIFNPWTWRADPSTRAFVEQLDLQPAGVPVAHVITRVEGGANDGHVNFAFDAITPTLIEPAPVGSATADIAYSFDGVAGASPSAVQRGGAFVTVHHSLTPTNDEGRAVQFFDILGGLDGNLNQQRVADEVATHRFATGNVRVDPRPVALAIAKGCLVRDAATGATTPALSGGLAFFTARHGGIDLNGIFNDTLARSSRLPLRKADIQALNLDRSGDLYAAIGDPINGLIQEYGARTSAGTSTSDERLRQEVFRRPIDAGSPDQTAMGGFYVDREINPGNSEKMALYRYFLEPLGVSVDKWSMGIRGRSRSYTFADVFGGYTAQLRSAIEANLGAEPYPGLAAPFDCGSLIAAVNSSFAALPAASAVPTFTDVQRIFNKGCIECHGGLDYPPFSEFFPATYLDFSEDENPPAGDDRLDRSHQMAVDFTTNDPATAYLYQRINNNSEDCPYGMMPCGGPKLAQADIETIRRWIVGARPYTNGDPHIRTVDGTNYDFQAAGEFVLLRGQGLEIQARQTPVETQTPLGPNAHTGLSSCVSINTAAAVRVGNHRITFQPPPRKGYERQDGMASNASRGEGMQLRVDGELVTVPERGLALPSGGRVLRTSGNGVQILAPGGTDVVLIPGFWTHHQLWFLNIDVRHARGTEGVMGAIAPGNWLPALPDGSVLGEKPSADAQRYKDLYGTFAGAWRVTDATSLFDYAAGTSTQTFTLGSWPGLSPQTCALPPEHATGAAPLAPLPIAVAKQQCSALREDDRRSNCEQDVMVTGDVDVAATYLATQRVLLNPLPKAPTLRLPEDNATGLGPRVDFVWDRASDAEDDRLQYSLCVWAAGDTLTQAACSDLPPPGRLLDTQMLDAWLWVLVVLLVLVLIVLIRARRHRARYVALALLLILAIVLLFVFGRSSTLGADTADLKRGQAYFWKVVVEDGQGGVVESETRRFATGK